MGVRGGKRTTQPAKPIVGVANQLLQPEGIAKAGLVVSTRAKEFKRIPPWRQLNQRARSFAEVVRDRKIIGVIDQSDEGGRIPRNQWGLVRRALASVALKVLDENPGPPPDCTDPGWYQGNVKLIACEDERSAALYKAAINKVGEVYPGAKLAVCEADFCWKRNFGNP